MLGGRRRKESWPELGSIADEWVEHIVIKRTKSRDRFMVWLSHSQKVKNGKQRESQQEKVKMKEAITQWRRTRSNDGYTFRSFRERGDVRKFCKREKIGWRESVTQVKSSGWAQAERALMLQLERLREMRSETDCERVAGHRFAPRLILDY